MTKRLLLILIAGIVLFNFSILVPDSGAEVPDAIRVGATVSVSGKFSTEIGPFQRLFKAWVDEVNSQGGIYLMMVKRGALMLLRK